MTQSPLSVSIFTCFAAAGADLSDFRSTLASYRAQTYPVHEILICDDADEADQPAVAALCQEYGATHLPCPFTHYALASARNMNRAFRQSTGDAILVVCSSFVLEAHWIERAMETLVEKGPGNLVTSHLGWSAFRFTADSPPVDLTAGYPNPFLTRRHDSYDQAKVLMYREDWIDFDTDFDCPDEEPGGDKGNFHGQVWWGYEQMHTHGRRLWMRKDLEMTHARNTQIKILWDSTLKRMAWSGSVLARKGGMPLSMGSPPPG